MVFGLAPCPCPCTGVGSDAFQGGNDTRGSIETNHTQTEARRKARRARAYTRGRRSQVAVEQGRNNNINAVRTALANTSPQGTHIGELCMAGLILIVCAEGAHHVLSENREITGSGQRGVRSPRSREDRGQGETQTQTQTPTVRQTDRQAGGRADGRREGRGRAWEGKRVWRRMSGES